MRFSGLVIIILTSLYVFSTLIITHLTTKAMETGSDYELVVKIAEFIKIDVSTAIGTIATAVVARYGLREFSSNFNKPSTNK